MFFTKCLYVVYKTTGGKAWNKPWGLKKLSRCQKRNRREDRRLIHRNLSVVKMASSLQPETPVQIYRPLADWQIKRMKTRLEEVRKQMNWEGTLIPKLARPIVDRIAQGSPRRAG